MTGTIIAQPDWGQIEADRQVRLERRQVEAAEDRAAELARLRAMRR